MTNWIFEEIYKNRPWSDKTKERIAKNLHGEKRKIGLVYIFCAIVAFLIITACLSGCKVQSFTQHHENDSVRIETRIDSIYIYERDSVFVDRYTKADTIFVMKEKWSIRYRDVVKEVRDTIVTKDVIVQPQPYIPDFHKNCTRGFWVLLAILILIIGGWAIRKYIKFRTGGLIK